MDCLHCGDCCLRISPISTSYGPCPYLIKDGTFYFCKVYDRRPSECRSHKFDFRFCPIGIEKLGISEPTEIAIRIDDGYRKTKSL